MSLFLKAIIGITLFGVFIPVLMRIIKNIYDKIKK